MDRDRNKCGDRRLCMICNPVPTLCEWLHNISCRRRRTLDYKRFRHEEP